VRASICHFRYICLSVYAIVYTSAFTFSPIQPAHRVAHVIPPASPSACQTAEWCHTSPPHTKMKSPPPACLKRVYIQASSVCLFKRAPHPPFQNGDRTSCHRLSVCLPSVRLAAHLPACVPERATTALPPGSRCFRPCVGPSECAPSSPLLGQPLPRTPPPSKAELPPELRDSVAVLSAPNPEAPGGETAVYVLGMSHVSAVSVGMVSTLITAVRPGVVVLELCKVRWARPTCWRCWVKDEMCGSRTRCVLGCCCRTGSVSEHQGPGFLSLLQLFRSLLENRGRVAHH
jgi:hypothetical protein